MKMYQIRSLKQNWCSNCVYTDEKVANDICKGMQSDMPEEGYYVTELRVFTLHENELPF